MNGDEHCRGWLGKEAKERMNHERLLLLDRRADPLGESRLRKSNSDTAVGDVARGAKQLACGQNLQKDLQIGLGVNIERWRLAPNAAKNHLGKLRSAKGGKIARRGLLGRIRIFVSYGLVRLNFNRIVLHRLRVERNLEAGVGVLALGNRPKQQNRIAGFLKIRRNRLRNVVQNTHDA